jgi:hypothetical protein
MYGPSMLYYSILESEMMAYKLLLVEETLDDYSNLSVPIVQILDGL